MSKHSQSFQLPVSGATTLKLCQEVAIQLGWRVLEVSSARISVKEVSPQVTSFTWPARIDIEIKSNGQEKSHLQLYGSIAGAGPIQRNHLQGQMGRFLNHLSLLVDTKSSSAATSNSSTNASTTSLTQEITRLKELLDQGVLTPEEFASAKAKLLGN